MTKKQAKEVMGSPKSVRGAIKNKYDQVIEVWEYLLDDTGGWSWGNKKYWIYFVDGKLSQWGEAGDWQPSKIYEMRFR